MKLILSAAVIAAIVLSSNTLVRANGGTITSGGATLAFAPYSGALGGTDFRPFGAAGGSYLPLTQWAYQPGFSSVSLVGIASESYVGDTATFVTNNGSTPGTITYQISATPSLVTVFTTFQFANTFSSVPDTRIYHLADIDAGGVTTNTATLFAPNDMKVVGGGKTVDFIGFNAPNERAAGELGTLNNPIYGFGVPPLTDGAGFPFGPGNFSGAYEWDRSLTQNIPTSYSVRFSVAVPEPVTIGAIALVAPLALRRGRRACNFA